MDNNSGYFTYKDHNERLPCTEAVGKTRLTRVFQVVGVVIRHHPLLRTRHLLCFIRDRGWMPTSRLVWKLRDWVIHQSHSVFSISLACQLLKSTCGGIAGWDARCAPWNPCDVEVREAGPGHLLPQVISWRPPGFLGRRGCKDSLASQFRASADSQKRAPPSRCTILPPLPSHLCANAQPPSICPAEATVCSGPDPACSQA